MKKNQMSMGVNMPKMPTAKMPKMPSMKMKGTGMPKMPRIFGAKKK